MDRRQKKTREAIFRALRSLLERKQYNAVTVQEIIDEADIGRSTFYAHFETKDDLLRQLCSDIFHHVFTDLLPQEEDTLDRRNLELKLGHILYHLQENSANVTSIIAADTDGLFMEYFKQYLTGLFNRYTMLFPANVPEDFLIHHLVGSFAETVKWWITEGTSRTPEETAGFYMQVLQMNI